MGSAGHGEARAHLVWRLPYLGLEPAIGGASFELPYHGRSPAGRGNTFTTLAGRLPGRMTGLAPIRLVAHCDTCGPTPRAGDNTAAVVILLSVVEPLRAAEYACQDPSRNIYDDLKQIKLVQLMSPNGVVARTPAPDHQPFWATAS